MSSDRSEARSRAVSSLAPLVLVMAAALAACVLVGEPRAFAGQADALRTLVQGGGRSSQNPACAVLTTAEVRAATGFTGYGDPSPGDPPGQGAGGGASCQFSAPAFAVDAKGNPLPAQKGPLVSIVLVEGKNYTRTVPIGKGCNKETVPGVGDEAFFEACPQPRMTRTPPLYVKAGTKDLILQMDIESPDTEAAIKPKVIGLAKAAAAKLR